MIKIREAIKVKEVIKKDIRVTLANKYTIVRKIIYSVHLYLPDAVLILYSVSSNAMK